ncbi:hypothetical protein A3L09_05790 [Thermococcus profundus]|uniref:Uncharacterized protein n=2 Tax=Thermococcus profundus TaxID=49899 RepID=A0A2Z2MBE4_THEPR|nr:hypothetical protein A3L09_05790 [Thermococcus profundus]
MKAVVTGKNQEPIKEVLPWARSDYLEAIMEERKREISEVLEVLDSLSLSEIPEEVRDITKRPRWEVFLAD